MREKNGTTYVFFFSTLNLRHGVSDNFHYFEFHQHFYVGMSCLNLGTENEDKKHTFYAEKSRA